MVEQLIQAQMETANAVHVVPRIIWDMVFFVFIIEHQFAVFILHAECQVRNGVHPPCPGDSRFLQTKPGLGGFLSGSGAIPLQETSWQSSTHS